MIEERMRLVLMKLFLKEGCMFRTLLVFLLIFGCSAASAETIKLKSGKVIEGKIVEQTTDYIKVDSGSGVNLTYYLDDVEQMGGDSKKKNESNITMVITHLGEPSMPVVPAMSQGEDGTNLNNILKFNDSLQSFVDKLNKSQIKQTFFQNRQEIAERITDIDGITLNTKGIVPDGVVKEYDGQGKVRSEGFFENNNPVGLWKIYYPSGQIAQVANYENGEKEGESRLYYESGKIKNEVFFHSGKPVGVARIYHESGFLGMEQDYRDKDYDVIIKAYKEEGGWASMYMRDGKSVKLEDYDEKGNLIKKNK